MPSQLPPTFFQIEPVLADAIGRGVEKRPMISISITGRPPSGLVVALISGEAPRVKRLIARCRFLCRSLRRCTVDEAFTLESF